MSSRALAARAPSRGFARDARFDGTTVVSRSEPCTETARAEGYATGRAAAEAEAAAQRQAEQAERASAERTLARIDAAATEILRQRLTEVVAQLCEATLAPLALDTDALTARTERAVAMLARGDDERVVRIHPYDLAAIVGRLPAEWTIEPDPSLERGAVRVESAQGGVEDGPDTWRRAIAEALRQC